MNISDPDQAYLSVLDLLHTRSLEGWDIPTLMREVAACLGGLGMQLCRIHIGRPILHPLFVVGAYTWYPDNEVELDTYTRSADHQDKGPFLQNIKLDGLTTLVLDEADEMLRMGFIDDVEWVLEQAPKQRQIALFSATMPAEIRKITRRYLRDPAEITIEVKSTTAETIRQRYWPVAGTHKLDALTRILEAETFDAMLVFVRTKTATLEVAEKLEARGFRATALNGDIAQKNRERIVAQLKAGKLDILVATDVAARGLDVDRISHVINYDIPHDTEAYVHRIGRTGRAGREADAILFVAPRERRMLQIIEKATRKEIELMELPSTDMVNNRRIEKFKQRISDTLAEEDLELFKGLIEQYRQEHEVGHDHQVKPGNIVGAIANEADIDSKYIGRINIFDDHSLVDLPEGMPRELLNQLKQVRVAGQRLNISLLRGRKKSSKHKSEAAKPNRQKPKTRQRDTKNKGKPKRLSQKRAG